MRIRTLAWLAIAAQPVFVASWVVAGALEPGYSGARSTISALAAEDAAHAWIVMAGLVAFGLSAVALAVALRMVLPARRASRVTVAMFAVVGGGLLVAAFVRLPCDPAEGACANGGHGVAATLAQLALYASPFALGWALSPGPRSREAIVAGAVGLGLALWSAAAPIGTEERAILTLGQVWFVVVAAGLLRTSTQTVEQTGEPVVEGRVAGAHRGRPRRERDERPPGRSGLVP